METIRLFLKMMSLGSDWEDELTDDEQDFFK